MQNEIGFAARVPWCRSRINQVAQRVIRRLAQTEEEPSRKSGRPPGVGLRLALIGERGVEHVGAKTGFRGVTAGPMLVSKQSVEPAVGNPAIRAIVNQLHMAVAGDQRVSVYPI